MDSTNRRVAFFLSTEDKINSRFAFPTSRFTRLFCDDIIYLNQNGFDLKR